MKIMGRTLIILLAALVVTAGLLAFSSSSMAAGLRGDLPGRDGFERGAGLGMPFPDAQRFPGGDAGLRAGRDGFREGRGEHGSQAGSLFGLTEVAKNFVLMALVVLIVVPGAYLLRRLRRRNAAAT